jgi:structural maintenance of chromosome 3 (chondroitin sulfate proteoglycan 6)
MQEGAGHAVMSAYVELVFDNSDGRLPIDRDEVRLRRTIGLKKDEYSIDKKQTTKAEVQNLLETAGFSRSNPYHIVQQGKIASMANMKDSERLDLLKDMGGTKVYEEKRTDSMNLMRDCEAKRATIGELISQLEGRLKELDEERAELAQYQDLDKKRRTLEYALLDLEVSKIRSELQAVEVKADAARARASKAADEVNDATLQLEAADRELAALATAQADLKHGAREAAAARETALRLRSKLELDVKEAEQRLHQGSTTQTAAQRDLASLRRDIAARERELEAAEGRLATARAREADLARRVASDNTRVQALYARQGGDGLYESAAERDDALGLEIARLEEAQATKRESQRLAQEQAADLEAQAEKGFEAVATAEASLASLDAGLAAAQAEQRDLHARRDSLQNRQKDLWRREDEAKRRDAELRADLAERERIMEASAPRDITRGLNSVKRLVKARGIKGVHGVLIELFDCLPQLYTAVETVASNQLFHVVVDDDRVATQLTELLTQERCGRATFMPLNRLRPPAMEYPTRWGQDVVPLVSKLKFEQKHAAAMHQVFGKALVCRSLAVAAEVAGMPDNQFNCVTMEGDQVERRGALRGGYVDTRRSRMEAM